MTIHPAHTPGYERTSATTDISLYGIYAPHFRYRQEQRDHAVAGAGGVAPPRLAGLRERIGARLIAWGTRIEGDCRRQPAPSPTA